MNQRNVFGNTVQQSEPISENSSELARRMLNVMSQIQSNQRSSSVCCDSPYFDIMRLAVEQTSTMTSENKQNEQLIVQKTIRFDHTRREFYYINNTNHRIYLKPIQVSQAINGKLKGYIGGLRITFQLPEFRQYYRALTPRLREEFRHTRL